MTQAPGPTGTCPSSSSTTKKQNIQVQKENPSTAANSTVAVASLLLLNDKLSIVGSTKQHPLQNELVVKNIGRYLPSWDIKAARQTCQLWSKTLKCYQTFKLTNTNLASFLQQQQSHPISNQNPPESHQFWNYKMYMYNLSFQTEQVYILFKEYGKYLTKLKLEISDPTQLTLNQFRNNILACSPNLKEFDLYDGSEDETISNSFWNQGSIFNETFPAQLYLPKLRKISFELHSVNGNYENDGFMIDFLNTTNRLEYISFIHGVCYFATKTNANQVLISALSNKIALQNLKVLKFKYVSESQLLGLIQLSERSSNGGGGGGGLQLREFRFHISNMKLEQLDGEIIHGNEGERFSWAIHKFLQCQSKCLKSLHVYVMPFSHYTGFSLVIPKLPLLETLKLKMIGGMSCCFESGSILKNFPALKILDYTRSDDKEEEDQKIEWEQQHMSLTVPVASVMELGIYPLRANYEWYRLSELFPNVTQLGVTVGAIKLVQGLWNKWPLLQSLTIESYEWTIDQDRVGYSAIDEALTGIPQEHHRACLSLLHSLNFPHYSHHELLKEYKLMPGISDLKHLTSLNLYDVAISDLSAYFGFIHPSKSCPLVHLVINNNTRHESNINNSLLLSLECRQAIHDNLGSTAYIKLD